MSSLTNPIFHDADKAREYLEAMLWPKGAICPKCEAVDCATKVQGKTARAGLYMCNACRKQFTVTVNTIYERSHIPLNKWLFATFLMCASKKGMSAHQISRMLELPYKTSWFMCHRIRYGMKEKKKVLSPLGGKNKVVECDESYVGGKARNRKNYVPPKYAVFGLVERGGKVRSQHIESVTGNNIGRIMREQIDSASFIMTDEAPVYKTFGEEFAGHGSVNHSKEEYAKLGGFIHTNSIENFFSLMKRAIVGVYHSVSPQHLNLYLAERDFVFNHRSKLGFDDAARTTMALKSIVGKRLTYRRTDGQTETA